MEPVVKHRFAVSRLHLPNGDVLRNQIVEALSDNTFRHRPLLEEEPMTEWLGGDFFLPSAADSVPEY